MPRRTGFPGRDAFAVRGKRRKLSGDDRRRKRKRKNPGRRNGAACPGTAERRETEAPAEMTEHLGTERPEAKMAGGTRERSARRKWRSARERSHRRTWRRTTEAERQEQKSSAKSGEVAGVDHGKRNLCGWRNTARTWEI